MKFGNHEPEPAGFQIAPMIDIVFLLLIFFILTWNVSKQDVDSNKEIVLPDTSEGETSHSYDHSTVIEIYADKRIQIGNKLFTVEQIRAQMQQTQRVFPEKPITIWADKEAKVDLLFKVYNICMGVGLKNVSLAGKNIEAVK